MKWQLRQRTVKGNGKGKGGASKFLICSAASQIWEQRKVFASMDEGERKRERERGREMPQRQPDKRQSVVHMDGLLPVETTAAAAAAQPSIDTATHFRGSNKATTRTATTATEAATSSTTKVKFFVLLVA